MTVDAPRPILCLVTDRARLGSSDGARLESLLNLIRSARLAGVDLVQIRENDLSDQALVDLVGQAVEMTREGTTRIIVNDRVDVALAAGAAGVHLRGDSFPAERIRHMVPSGWTIGRSVHGLDEALEVTATKAVDYVTFGTVFETASKPGTPGAGLEALGRIVEAVPVPVLAIGGVTVDRVAGVGASGAAGLAAIGIFAEAGESTEALQALATTMRSTFARSAVHKHK